LSEDESKALRSQLQSHWRVDSGRNWFPLTEQRVPTDVIAFRADEFDDNVPLLKEILISHGIDRLFELREGEFVCEVTTNEFDPYYNGAEGFWTSSDMDWLIYASHESSITLAGDWLVAAIVEKWPNWQQHLYP